MISPLLGYNNNVRHRGHVFHIQTEDSGIKHPHVFTHLFADGGRILKTLKTSYAEHLGSEKLAETVRGLMKQQHKAMFVALRDGRFDHLIESTADSSQETEEAGASGENPSVSEAPASSQPARTPQRAQAPDLFTSLSPNPAPLDIETLERAAMAAQGARPEPENLDSEPNLERTASGRYAQTRPATIFSSSQVTTSIFGEDLVSERSLDEVILGYLAEDLGKAEP